jgi:CubicO group peptidase (beta-lactamase class C family)
VSEPLIEGLDALARGILDARAAASLAVAVTDRERTLAVRSYGEAGDATMFQIGSIGKSFTAIVTLQLVQEGLLDLHAPVTDALPWFSVRGAERPITLHHLLTHSAGLLRGAEIATACNYDVLGLAETAVGFQPGEHHWYSNVGYRAIGCALERVTGTPYPALVRRRILDPLGMASSEPWIVPEMRPRLAQTHVPAYDDRPWRPEHGLVHGTWIDSAEADGCICTSAGDLAIYLRAIMTRDPRLLDAGSWGAMLTPHVEDDQEGKGEHYGYGIGITEHGFAHGGAMIGTESMLVAGDDGFGAVAMATGPIWADVLTDAALALARGEQPAPFAPKLDDPMVDDDSCPQEWAPFLGHYRSHNAWLTNFRVVGHDGGLQWGFDHLGSTREPVTHLGDGVFRVGKEWSPERLRFDTVMDGRAQRAWLSGAAYHRSFRQELLQP